MSDLNDIKQLDRLARVGADLPPGMDVAGAVLSRIRAGESADPQIISETGAIRVLAGASIVALAAALLVVVMVWSMVEAPMDSIDMASQQNAEWLQ